MISIDIFLVIILFYANELLTEIIWTDNWCDKCIITPLYSSLISIKEWCESCGQTKIPDLVTLVETNIFLIIF